MAVKLELYRVFKEVAETGNISLAAKNLYISQSAVSQSIKQLETALQARLFARSPRGVSLTWEGQMLYQYVRSALGLLATGEDKLSQAQQLLLGTLTIGASDTVTSFFLTPYLEAFHRQHPGIRLKIVSGRSAKVLSMLKSGAVDIAFASSPTDPAALHTWSCFATHSVFVAGSGYDCDFDHVYTRQEIAEFPLILLERKASSPGVSGAVLSAKRYHPDAGNRALLPEPPGIPGPDRPGGGRCDAGVCAEGPGQRGHPPAENRLHHSRPQRGHVHPAGRDAHRRGLRLYGDGPAGRPVTAMEQLFLILELVGTLAFAASGAITGLKKNMDVFGVCILGLTTAVGGGVIRDLLLGITPPGTFQDPIYAVVALLTSLVLFLPRIRRLLMWDQRLYDLVLLIMDSAGLGIFTVAGIRIAYEHAARPTLFLLVFVGVVTGVGGGVLRDVLAGDTPYIFVKHVYASASLAGALACVVLWPLVGEMAAMLCGSALVVAVRILSAHFRWNLPHAHD